MSGKDRDEIKALREEIKALREELASRPTFVPPSPPYYSWPYHPPYTYWPYWPITYTSGYVGTSSTTITLGDVCDGGGVTVT